MGRTQEERRAETRALLLDAASDLFAHKGFHATSAEAVAAAAGRTTGALYDHFGGKDGLRKHIRKIVAELAATMGTHHERIYLVGGSWRAIARLDKARLDLGVDVRSIAARLESWSRLLFGGIQRRDVLGCIGERGIVCAGVFGRGLEFGTAAAREGQR